jgi:hypothetical protein
VHHSRGQAKKKNSTCTTNSKHLYAAIISFVGKTAYPIYQIIDSSMVTLSLATQASHNPAMIEYKTIITLNKGSYPAPPIAICAFVLRN